LINYFQISSDVTVNVFFVHCDNCQEVMPSLHGQTKIENYCHTMIRHRATLM